MIRTILALCSRDQGHRDMYSRLEQALLLFSEQSRQQETQEPSPKNPWYLLIQQAEKQGVAPLLHKHIRSLDNQPMPVPILRTLQSLFLRNRRVTTIRSQAMATVLAAMAAENIPVLVIKGIALANFAYSEPGLRSMRDMDLLVDKNRLERAQDILLNLGYQPEKEHDIPDDYYHLVPMQKTVSGLQVTIEVHHNLLPFTGQYQPWPLDKSYPTALEFELDNIRARTLNLEETLWYVYLHGFQAPLSYEPFRMLHLADMVTLVERFIDTINWQQVRRENPTLTNVLACLHDLTPFSDRVVERLNIMPRKPPRGMGQPYRGWPLRKLTSIDKSELPQLVFDTLWPAPWWLQIYYGHLRGIGYLKARLYEHPQMVWRWIKAFRHLSVTEDKIC